MPESEDPKKVTNYNMEGSQNAGGVVNADTVNAQRIGGDIWNIKNFFFGQHKAASDKQLTRQKYENRRILLSKVRNSWVQGVLERSLYARILIELGLEERLDAVNHLGEMVWETPDQPRQFLPAGTRVIDKFDEMVAGRTLLILGEPGSGKTITLLQLARDLIDRAENDANQPIPVVFNLSSWGSEKQNQTIPNWLVQRLNQEYKVSKKVGTFWVKNQQLLLLLDGLDEVKEERRNLCVQALNRFRQDYGETEIVIASRVFDYERLSYRLDLQRAIYLQPLTQEQINHYFDSAGSQLAVVKTLWQEDETLQELAKSPLMLNIMSLAYQGIESEHLLVISSLDGRRKDLFDKYIQRMFERRRSSYKQLYKTFQKQHYHKPFYTNEESKHWLVWLAKRMSLEGETVFLIECMQPTWLQNKTEKVFYGAGVVLILTLIFWLSAVLTFSGQFTISEGLRAGLFFSLITLSLSNGIFKIKIVETINFSWKKSISQLKLFLIVSLIFVMLFLMFELISGGLLIRGLSDVLNSYLILLFLVLVMGLVYAPIIALIGGLSGSELEVKAYSNQGIWHSTMNFIIVCLISVLMYAPIIGVIGLTNGLDTGLSYVLLIWLFFGLPFG